MRKNRTIPKSEKTFLDKYNPKEYEKPSVTSDMLLFSMIHKKLHILLIQRGGHPYKDYWAMPGGFVNMNESTEEAAYRELKEETGIEDVYLEQLATFSESHRDPRMRVISVAYIALVKSEHLTVIAGDDAIEARWFEVNTLLKRLETEDVLAFDHEEILKLAMKRLRGKAFYTNVLFQLLPQEFTIRELRVVFEEVLNKKLHAPNFRREMMSRLVPTGRMEKSRHRPAELYRVNEDYFDEE